eukprot:TRINITY_DN9087_c0_g1_i1.p2 TRINITY_DN9087_c0_g1~~TRINITY_DN9087_c0_g1_i1.p2  ORF type:complete len:180 (-),score=16.75 TRINITY_DN9087_c0_g1_i1:10-549(-)
MARNNQTDQWPLSVAMNENGVTIEDVLETGPYGRCVYHCDNDVVDQQVVLMEFETGVTATFSMVAHTKDICVRKTRIFGSLGEIECVDGRSIVLTRHGGESESIEFDGPPANTHLRGHHGADYYLAKAFFRRCSARRRVVDSQRSARHARIASRRVLRRTRATRKASSGSMNINMNLLS